MSQGNAGTCHLALSLAKTNNWSPLCELDGGVWFYFSSDFKPGQCYGTQIQYILIQQDLFPQADVIFGQDYIS